MMEQDTDDLGKTTERTPVWLVTHFQPNKKPFLWSAVTLVMLTWWIGTPTPPDASSGLWPQEASAVAPSTHKCLTAVVRHSVPVQIQDITM